MATELVPIQKTGLTLYEVEDNLAALANTFEVVEETEAKRIILDEIGQAIRRVKEKRDAVVGFLRALRGATEVRRSGDRTSQD